MGSILAVVPRHERPSIRARARRLRGVAAGVPALPHRLRHRTCVQVAAMAPELAADGLSLLLRHALWSYWLDDRLDATGIDVAGAARLRAGVVAVTAGAEVCPADPLLADLARIACDLSRYDRGGDVVAWYGRALRDTVAAEEEQVRARAGARTGAGTGSGATSIERYLAGASETVNYRSFAYALLAAGGYELTGPQLPHIDSALRHASRALRLANDLRSRARDDRAGAPNVLRCRTAAGAPVTTGAVWAEAGRRVEAHDTALRDLAGRGLVPDPVARALIRSLAQSIRLYRRTDLR